MAHKNHPRLTLEDLATLNDEICEVTRARLPLELGLKSAAGGLRRQVNEVLDSLAQQLDSGVSLEVAIENHPRSFPPVYRALITAGLKTGRLDQALESLSIFSRGLDELRHKIAMALAYPTLVLSLAWILWSLFLVTLFPGLDASMVGLGVSDGTSQRFMRTATTTIGIWAPILPAGLFLAGACWWLSRRWMLHPTADQYRWHPGRIAASALRRLPWLGPILMNFHRATFTEVLAMMLENDVPLSEAVTLAIDASGEPQLSRHRDEITARIRDGDSLSNVLQRFHSTTPFVRWMIDVAERQGALQPALKHASEILRRRADYQAEYFQVAFPVVVLATVAGGAVLLYSLSLFLPIVDLLNGLSTP